MPRPVASRLSRRAADDEGLARDHAGHAAALGHGVGVHHPGHGLLVGAEIGRGNVEVGADEQHDLRRIATGERFELVAGHGAGRAPHAAFGPAVGEAHERALPGHEHGERGHLAHVHVGVVAQAALGGAEGGVVMDAVAHEDFRPPVVHAHGDGHHEARRG